MTVSGFVHDKGGQVFDVQNPSYGAKGDTKRKTGGSISASSSTFTASSSTFVAGDVGKVITVQGAAASGAVLSTTIASYTSATQVTLTAPAGTTVSNANFAFGTDDTAAILATIGAAASVGTVYAPPGIYTIRGASNSNAPISFASKGGLVGSGGNPLSAGPATTFLCSDATAGIVTASAGTYQGFCCDGNHIATTPLQNGTVVSGSSTTVGSGATFIDVWATASMGNGWTIYGSQNCSYYDCGSIKNAQDGVYVDGGAGGLAFWGFIESASVRYAVHGGINVTGGTGTRGGKTEAIRFYGGRLSTVSSDPAAASKVYLRGAYDWKFHDVTILGDNLTGPTVDLDQSAGEVLDFSSCRISATVTGNNPGLACIKVGGSPPGGASALVFLVTDKIRFTAGDTSVYLAAVGNYRYSALDWVFDATAHGPTGASGLDVETYLRGRAGVWHSTSASSPWSGTVKYRIDWQGEVELQGILSSSGGGGTIFTVPSGYRPGGGSGPTMQLPVALANGAAAVTVAGTGVVASTYTGTSNLYLDGIRFPVD